MSSSNHNNNNSTFDDCSHPPLNNNNPFYLNQQLMFKQQQLQSSLSSSSSSSSNMYQMQHLPPPHFSEYQQQYAHLPFDFSNQSHSQQQPQQHSHSSSHKRSHSSSFNNSNWSIANQLLSMSRDTATSSVDSSPVSSSSPPTSPSLSSSGMNSYGLYSSSNNISLSTNTIPNYPPRGKSGNGLRPDLSLSLSDEYIQNNRNSSPSNEDLTSSPPQSPSVSPRFVPPPVQNQNGKNKQLTQQPTSANIEEDYEYLRGTWVKAREISQDIIKITKQATKYDFTLVDFYPNLKKEYENLGNLLNSMVEKVDTLKSDERQKKKRKESDRNAEKRKKRREATLLLNNVCKSCLTTDTPEWRRGPDGTKSLCNACGLHYAKNLKRETLNQPPTHIAPGKESMKVVSILN